MATTIYDHLLHAPLSSRSITDVKEWWMLHLATVKPWSSPFEQCVAAGFALDRIGYTFVSGYQIAMRILTNMEGGEQEKRMCLCATESTPGAPPGSILTTVTKVGPGEWVLSGEKGFVTLGTYAERLVIVARDADAKQDPKHVKLRLVCVHPQAEGVTIIERPPLDYIPEVPHARVRLANVRVKESDFVGPDCSDGFLDYVKPFRTIEDCYVNAAFLGYLVQSIRRFCVPIDVTSAQVLIQKVLVIIAALHQVSRLASSLPSTHVLLAGILPQVEMVTAQAKELFEASVSIPNYAEFRSNFERDVKLLNVASRAQTARTKVAWKKLNARL